MRVRIFFYLLFLVPVISTVCILGCSQESKEVIKIGTTVSLEGKYLRLSSEQLNGLNFWVEETNKKGGILGRKIQLIFYDDKSSPVEAAKLTAQLIKFDKVDFLVSPYSSPMAMKASEISEKHNIPMIIAGASATDIWQRGFKNIFGMYTPASRYMDGIVEFARENNIKNVALIYEKNNPYTEDLASGVKRKIRDENLNLIFIESYESLNDFKKLIQLIKTSKAEMLIGGSYLNDSVAIVEEAFKQKYFPQIMIFAVGPGLPDFGARLQNKAEGVMGNSQWEMSLPIKDVKEFSEKYIDKYGYKPGYHAAGGYGAGQVIETVIKKNGSVDKAKFSDTVRDLKTHTIFGKFSVDKNGMQVGKPGYTIQWFGKKRIIVLPKEFADRNPVIPLPVDSKERAN